MRIDPNDYEAYEFIDPRDADTSFDDLTEEEQENERDEESNWNDFGNS
jgi:hypothetical protein